MSAGRIVTQQIEAYNNRDLERNMALFSDDFKIINFSDGDVLVDCRQACREMYSHLFANSPNLFAEVIKRIDFADKVIIHEYILGRNGSNEKVEQLMLFKVKNKKIEKMYRL